MDNGGYRAFISSVSGSILRHLEVSPTLQETVQLADGSGKAVDLGYTWPRVNGHRVKTCIALDEETSTPLLGVLTLGELLLGVDQKEGRLVPLTDMPL